MILCLTILIVLLIVSLAYTLSQIAGKSFRDSAYDKDHTSYGFFVCVMLAFTVGSLGTKTFYFDGGKIKDSIKRAQIEEAKRTLRKYDALEEKPVEAPAK